MLSLAAYKGLNSLNHHMSLEANPFPVPPKVKQKFQLTTWFQSYETSTRRSSSAVPRILVHRNFAIIHVCVPLICYACGNVVMWQQITNINLKVHKTMASDWKNFTIQWEDKKLPIWQCGQGHKALGYKKKQGSLVLWKC